MEALWRRGTVAGVIMHDKDIERDTGEGVMGD